MKLFYIITCLLVVSTNARLLGNRGSGNGGRGGGRGGQGAGAAQGGATQGGSQGGGSVQGGGRGNAGANRGSGLTAGMDVKMEDLDAAESEDLLFMREEEKLARDVYVTLYKKWGNPTFDNISEAENWHMQRMLDMIKLYGLTDPITTDTTGVFQNSDLQALYDELVAKGSVSLEDALMVGAAIEEIDIDDLQKAIVKTDEETLKNAYGNLRNGSKNHLRAFVRQLNRLGVDYEAQHLSDTEVKAILGN